MEQSSTVPQSIYKEDYLIDPWSSIHLWCNSGKEVSNNKIQRVKVTQYDPLYLPPQYKKAGGQQDGEHGWVQHVKGEQYQRIFFKCLCDSEWSS